MNSFGGVPIHITPAATEEVIRWPIKKRSRRLHKKMTKRLGPQIFRKPCAFQTPFGWVVHPDVYAEWKRLTDWNSANG